MRLQSRIRDTFNVVVRLVELLGANILGEMAQKIEESFTVDVIDWESETVLPQIDTARCIASQSSPSQNHRMTLLLTGATGFLAKYILPLLMEDKQVVKIHCVAIRPKAEDSTRNISVSSEKIIMHQGDLSLPFLGLPESEFWALSDEVDVILHLGAVRSFWDSYHVLRPTIVSST